MLVAVRSTRTEQEAPKDADDWRLKYQKYYKRGLRAGFRQGFKEGYDRAREENANGRKK